MRVLGIDCGTEYTGYGVVDLLSDSRNNDRLVCIVCGAIKVSPRDPMPARLSRISIGLQELISQHRPHRDNRGCLSVGPGGLSFAEIDELLRGIPSKGKLVGLDIVEVNPYRDPSGRTAQTAIRLMVDLLGAAFH